MPRKRADKLARTAEPAGIRHPLIRQHAGKVQVEPDNAVQPRTSVFLSVTCIWLFRNGT